MDNFDAAHTSIESYEFKKKPDRKVNSGTQNPDMYIYLKKKHLNLQQDFEDFTSEEKNNKYSCHLGRTTCWGRETDSFLKESQLGDVINSFLSIEKSGFLTKDLSDILIFMTDEGNTPSISDSKVEGKDDEIAEKTIKSEPISNASTFQLRAECRESGARSSIDTDSKDVQGLLTMVTPSEDNLREDLVFLQAPSFNKLMIFSGKSPMDVRTRMLSLSFQTKCHTHNEVSRVLQMLHVGTSIKCFGEFNIQDFVPLCPQLFYSAYPNQLVKSPYEILPLPDCKQSSEDQQRSLPLSKESPYEKLPLSDCKQSSEDQPRSLPLSKDLSSNSRESFVVDNKDRGKHKVVKFRNRILFASDVPSGTKVTSEWMDQHNRPEIQLKVVGNDLHLKCVGERCNAGTNLWDIKTKDGTIQIISSDIDEKLQHKYSGTNTCLIIKNTTIEDLGYKYSLSVFGIGKIGDVMPSEERIVPGEENVRFDCSEQKCNFTMIGFYPKPNHSDFEIRREEKLITIRNPRIKVSEEGSPFYQVEFDIDITLPCNQLVKLNISNWGHNLPVNLTNQCEAEEDGSLGPGAIAGIVIGTGLVLLICCIICIIYRKEIINKWRNRFGSSQKRQCPPEQRDEEDGL